MKRKLLTALTCSTLLMGMAACSSNDKTATESKPKQEAKKPEPVTTTSLISEFKKAGIEAENATDLPQKEFGNMRKDGKRILTPKLGEDKGGRVFEFSKKEDLEKAKKYYDELGNSAPMLFSHTYAKGNFLLQMNGEMKDEEFNKYKEVMDKVVK
ncbi:stress protein [Bacillus toyonensis]|uniref:stress protein n=1 Tax=Bacillus toyonensis TaxID=155322 RepID=UPI000BF189E1|nr:stress protein [Bacillus toyonensis]PEK83404.1 stress protein [Bacillus toyonensis]PEO49296.1 stress protein [Bacillus toyonensis]PFY35756.1 stress protein [Bacillus toyonensis]PFY43887.1 stress protein [Bacillus toyonensis]PFY78178.1 stress protein [Bacillus toyonensis]